jgi:hypothetical protein
VKDKDFHRRLRADDADRSKSAVWSEIAPMYAKKQAELKGET